MLPNLIEASHSHIAAAAAAELPIDVNVNPVIGILSQPLPDSLKDDPRFEGKTSYIMQAYAQWVIGAGARVVPIILEDDHSVVDEKLSKINGVLFPGGAGDYLELGKYIFDSLIEENEQGNHYPIWGTCLGFQNLAIFASGGSPLSNLESTEHSLTLNFSSGSPKPEKTTRMFSGFEHPELFNEKAMTFNHHSFGVSLDTFRTDMNLAQFFDWTSWSEDPVTKDVFVATMEAWKVPFFGVQFHPEKVLTMYNTDTINHTWESVEANRYFADYFVGHARQNTNTCGDWTDCQAMMIDNWAPIVTDTYYGTVYAF